MQGYDAKLRVVATCPCRIVFHLKLELSEGQNHTLVWAISTNPMPESEHYQQRRDGFGLYSMDNTNKWPLLMIRNATTWAVDLDD